MFYQGSLVEGTDEVSSLPLSFLTLDFGTLRYTIDAVTLSNFELANVHLINFVGPHGLRFDFDFKVIEFTVQVQIIVDDFFVVAFFNPIA